MTRSTVALALVAVLLLAVAATVRVRTAPREGPDLKPRPEALDHGLAAAALVERGEFALRIGDARYPPRPPPGFPLLAAPIVALEGGDPSAAADAAFLFGLAGVAVVLLLGALAAGVLGGATAGAVVALSPLAIDLSGLAMSETASAALVGTVLLAGAFAAWRRPDGVPRSGALLLAGVAAGLAVTVRPSNAAVLLPVVLFYGTRHALAPPRGRALGAVRFAAGPAVVALLLLAGHRWRTFGSPLADGERFWGSASAGSSDLPSPAAFGLELLGVGSLWSVGAALLAVVGLARLLVLARRCPVARLLALATGTTLPAMVGFHLLADRPDPRFLVPLLPLLAVLAGSGAEALRAGVARLVGPRAGGPAGALAGVALLAVAIVAPARALAPEVLTTPRVRPLPPMTRWLSSLDAELPRGSIVVCNFPVTLAAPALGDGREVIVTNRRTADPHLAAIDELGRKGRDGRIPDVRSLASGDRVDDATLADLVRWVREGRPAFYVAVAGEGRAGAGVNALAPRGLETVETIARPPITVYELRLRR
ncbi:MAG: hypothetical protein ACF8XB_16965 [Planctomycetota bacterium JB042]